MNFSYVIFDMDGVLIDSEPFWHSSEKEIFLREGVEISEEMCVMAQGKKSEHVIEDWKKIFPLLKRPTSEYVIEIENDVKNKIKTFGKPMEGVIEALEFFKQNGIKTAVASSSKYALINTVIEKLGIKDYFSAIHSSEDEKFGKPEPYVFLSAMKKLGAKSSSDCLVIEDSSNGVLAGKRAGMKVVAVPEKSHFSDSSFDIADYKIHSLKEITKLW